MQEFESPVRVVPPSFPDNSFNLKEFGGTDGGGADNTQAFRKAIDACSRQGGRVVVPKGRWFTGPIHFKSNVNLHLEEGAELLFSSAPSDYLPPVFCRWEGVECYNYSPLIYAHDCENIALTGEGVVLGNGEPWWPWKRLQRDAARRLYHAEHDGIPVELRVFATEKDALRPYFVQFIACRNVLVEGLTFVDGPMWTISPVYCENALFKNLNIRTSGPNTDGINPESSKNVVIEDCTFETGDDCVAISSGMNEDGWRVGRSCENILVRRCTMRGGHACVALGSGVSGGISGVYVRDCDFTGSGERGIRIKTMPGRGGFVRNVHFENLIISNKKFHALEITASYPSSSAPSTSGALTEISDVGFARISGVNNESAIEISGEPDKPIAGLRLSDISLEGRSGLSIKNVERISADNVNISVVGSPPA